jgi:hypothetical protein
VGINGGYKIVNLLGKRIVKAKELRAKKTVAFARGWPGEQLVRGPADGRGAKDRRDRGLGRDGGGPRVGGDYAGPVWAGKRWQFIFSPEEGEES